MRASGEHPSGSYDQISAAAGTIPSRHWRAELVMQVRSHEKSLPVVLTTNPVRRKDSIKSTMSH